MKQSRSFLMSACFLAAAFYIPEISRASLDDSDSNDDLQVLYAVYGGSDSGTVYCNNVTDQVVQLFHDPHKGFSAHAEDLNLDVDVDVCSLIILYNYDGHRHFFVRQHTGPKVSQGLVKEAAMIDDAKAAPISNPTDSSAFDTDVHVVFAAYGAFETYVDETDVVTKALESPGDLVASDDAMGGDPLHGCAKMLLVIYDYKGKRHFFAAAQDQHVKIDSGALVTFKPEKTSDVSASDTPPSSPPPAPPPVATPNYKPGGPTPFGHL